MARKRIGEVLLERGLITVPQLDAALRRHRPGSERLGATLVALGALSEVQLTATLAEMQGLQVIDLARAEPEWSAVHLLPADFCLRHQLFPVALRDEPGRRILTVAMADPLDLPALDAVERRTGCKARAVLATGSSIRGAIARYHQRAEPRFDTGETMTLIRPGGEVVEVDLELEVEEAEVLPLENELPPRRGTAVADDLEFLFGRRAPVPPDRLAGIERRIAGLARLLESKGICTRAELEGALGQSSPSPASPAAFSRSRIRALPT